MRCIEGVSSRSKDLVVGDTQRAKFRGVGLSDGNRTQVDEPLNELRVALGWFSVFVQKRSKGGGHRFAVF